MQAHVRFKQLDDQAVSRMEKALHPSARPLLRDKE